MGRTPTYTELGVFSVMWSEHCSYKSSRVWLKQLPTKAPWVIHGPGENAGVVDIGDGLAAVFKMESHNHPQLHRALPGRGDGGRRHPAGRVHHGRAADRQPERAALRAARPSPHEAHRRRRGARHRRLRQLRRRPDRRRRDQFPPLLRRQPAGQRDDRRHRPARTRFFCPPRPASATRWSMSVPKPAGTAFTARPWPRPSSPPIRKKNGRPCRSATRSPKSC